MLIDTDSNGESDASPVERPPVIPERLWALIPSGRHADYRKAAASGLRRGIHPETTVIDKLEREGACSYDAIERALGSDGNHGSPCNAADDKPRGEVLPAEASGTDDGTRPMRPPLWPFGASGYCRTALPLGEIGSVLHYDCGFDGPTAAEIEWLVLRGVSRDPAFVRRDPGNLKFLGCVLPSGVLQALGSAILFECDCVIADVRRRQAEGDVSAMAWLDPETLVF